MNLDEYVDQMGKVLKDGALELKTQGEFYFDNTLAKEITRTCPEQIKNTPILSFVLGMARRVFVMAVDWAYYKHIENMVTKIDKNT